MSKFQKKQSKLNKNIYLRALTHMFKMNELFVIFVWKSLIFSKMLKRIVFFLFFFSSAVSYSQISGIQSEKRTKVRIAIVGLTHGHSNSVFRHFENEQYEIVGIAESNQDLQARFMKKYDIKTDLFYIDLTDMLRKVNPEGVVVFTSTYEHLEVVKVCAPLGIHVMVEKPFAVNKEHAHIMAELADEYGIDTI